MRFFTWIRKNRTTINGILITVFSSLILNTISDAGGNLFYEYESIITKIFEFRTLSGLLTIVSLVAFIVFNASYVIARQHFNKKTLSQAFPELMKKYTSPSLIDSLGNGCISWGEGKTVEICNDIIFGWKSKNIMVDRYDDGLYIFYSEEDSKHRFGNKEYYFNQNDYIEYKESEKFKDVIKKGNNLERFMLNKCSKNYDKNNRKLLLSIGRTEWSQTSYVWDRFGKIVGSEVESNSLMKEYASGIKGGDQAEPYLPNSLCMHLLIETKDNKVVLALISESKRNDNPGSWAATIGEQLDGNDFIHEGNDFSEDFVKIWVRRAFAEEFKLSDVVYNDIVDEESFRCLSVDFESDRYNFALFCTIQLRYSFEVFYKKVEVLLSTEEASKLCAITLDEIPDVLMTYNDPEKRKNYHPSTYLRLLLYFIHKNGYSRAEKKLIECDKRNTR